MIKYSPAIHPIPAVRADGVGILTVEAKESHLFANKGNSMDGTTRLWLWIAFIGMTIGAVIFGSKAAAMRKKEGMEFPLESFFITLVAAYVPNNGS